MTKARALKRRYILFEYRGPPVAADQLKRSLYAEALRFFGEYGLSFAALKLVGYDSGERCGIIRCERGRLDDVLGFLALIGSLEGAECRIVAVKSSGTIRGLGAPASVAAARPGK
jgi:RNase P/RNase MRP subunit POP5